MRTRRIELAPVVDLMYNLVSDSVDVFWNVDVAWTIVSLVIH